MRNKDCSTWDSAVQHLFHSPCHLFDTYIASKTAYRAVSAPRWLNRIFLWVMGFFLYTFLLVCSMLDVLHVVYCTRWPSFLNAPKFCTYVCWCRNRFKVSFEFKRSHKHVFTIIQVRYKQQGWGKYIIPGRREVLLRVHELTWAKQ